MSLAVIAIAALGAAFYLRYLVIENSNVGLACDANLQSSLCAARRITIALFTYSAFGITAAAVAALNLLRPSVVFLAVALAAAALGIVLYNVALSGLAFGLLTLSLARREFEPE
ncbi:MAG: hypothetical protein JO245_05430 [Pseudolabrys sp.]|nr:hypothetical protein [Pseudolabrys sp.]